ncbi:DNA repair protein [Lentibacter sp. XHP0401]|uniref:DNA repair protein n=1 Tax=Lentibacter sp. XHP0401 TaxID=2984334 RepID=UPI0021E783E4|nr:DNA repair protein [Lentibacter sp. XHP0401]MCV2891862.1 DNA repair protein [Lentibacter sp. XHP0401]
MNTFMHGLRVITYLLHRLAFFLVILGALSALGYTALCAFGLMPWLEMQLSFGGATVENAGVWVQSGLTAFVVMLAFFLPSTKRILTLENSHRSFQLGMHDVARAYHHAHAADRSGNFKLSSEFDSVRERLVYLRNHPDLGSLEPDVLEAAAQMSHISKELSNIYSDDALARARDFLRQRQTEVENFNARLGNAKLVATELKHWLHEVELEESVAASQLERLRDELHEVLPELGKIAMVEVEVERDTVTHLPRAAE